MSTVVKLSDLVGEHVLDAVDYVEAGDEHGSACRFRLDGIVYTAKEDPEDGYRSPMEEITASAETQITNVFEPTVVIGSNPRLGGCCVDDLLTLVDKNNGKTVLQVGTEMLDSYYPKFVADFNPKNMSINSGV